MTQKNLLLVASLLIAVAGCSKAAPAGFWSEFQEGQRTQHLSQTGGRGGWTAAHRVAGAAESFSAQRVKSFAADHGWKFISEQKVTGDAMKTWTTWQGTPIFPLGYDGFAPSKSDAAYDHFPRWMTANATLLTFDSGWITSIGGVVKPANGYVLLAEDGKALSVYHLWGE